MIVPAFLVSLLVLLYTYDLKNRPTYNKVEVINDITANFLIIYFKIIIVLNTSFY